VKLALSDNGQYLYVGLEGEPAVQRIDLASRTVNLRFLLGTSSPPLVNDFFVDDMQVLPGNSQAVAVSRRNNCCSPRHEGVAIYDNGVPRTRTTPGHTGANVIEFSASAAILYGYNNETTEFGFRRMTVDAEGVFVASVFDSFRPPPTLISGFGVDIKFAGGRIFTTSGRVIDPVTPAPLATFGVPAFGNLVVPDASLNRVFFLSSDSSTSRWSLRAFDMTSVPPVRLGREDISGVTGNPGSLIRWGAKGLAFLTSGGQIFLVESTALIP
jgi:hypothetical protein